MFESLIWYTEWCMTFQEGVLRCYEVIQDMMFVRNSAHKMVRPSGSSVPQSPIGVLDAACLSCKRDVSTAGSHATCHDSPASKRRKLNSSSISWVRGPWRFLALPSSSLVWFVREMVCSEFWQRSGQKIKKKETQKGGSNKTGQPISHPLIYLKMKPKKEKKNLRWTSIWFWKDEMKRTEKKWKGMRNKETKSIMFRNEVTRCVGILLLLLLFM